MKLFLLSSICAVLAHAEAVVTTDFDNSVALEKAPVWRAECDKNSGVSCGNLGALYALGKGVAHDDAKAFEYYEKACRFGQALRCLRAGTFAVNGKGLVASPEKAAELFALGCKLFDPESCISYYAVTHGAKVGLDGLPKKLAEFPKPDPAMLQSVATTLTLACDKGFANACGNLGGLYEEGDAVARELSKALKYYERACDLGESERCARAGRYYANGAGTAPDKVKAARLFEKFCQLKNTIVCPLAEKAKRGMAIELKMAEGKAEPSVKQPSILVQPASTFTATATLSILPPEHSNPEMKKPPPFSPIGAPPWALAPPLDPVGTEGLPSEIAVLVQGCNQGDARACGNAAASFVDDSGKPTSRPEFSRRLYEKACGFGRAQRCADLARFFANGWGAEKSPEREKAALKKACELGHKPSCELPKKP